MPQNRPRGAPVAVRRKATMPAAESAAAIVSPGSASISAPSKLRQTGSAARRDVGVAEAHALAAQAWDREEFRSSPSSMNGPIAVQKPFRGTYTVLITPFTADGEEVDVAALERLVDFQIEEGIHGLIPLGSTGEFLCVSRTSGRDHRDRGQAGGRPRARADRHRRGGHAEVVRASREAESMGADGVMIIPPFYSVPTDDELFHHYKKVADAIGIPIMVYNNPATANVDLLPAMLARLSPIPNCRYVKESTLESTRVRDIIAPLRRPDGGVRRRAGLRERLAGRDRLGRGLQQRDAALVARACSTPRPSRRDRDKALPLYRKLPPLLPWVGGPRYVSGTKAAFRLMGMAMGPPRPPRLPLPGRRPAGAGAASCRIWASCRPAAPRRNRGDPGDHASPPAVRRRACRGGHARFRPDLRARACRTANWSSRAP